MHKIYLSLLITSLSYAQSISFQEVLNLTLQNNKDLQYQKLNIESSNLNAKTIDSINYGKLSITEELSRTNHSGYVFNSKLSSREATFRDFGFAQQNEGMDVQPRDLNYPDARNNYNTKVKDIS